MVTHGVSTEEKGTRLRGEEEEPIRETGRWTLLFHTLKYAVHVTAAFSVALCIKNSSQKTLPEATRDQKATE